MKNGAHVTIRDTGELKIPRVYEVSMTVGVHPEEGAATPGYDGGLTVAQVAAVNEWGAGPIKPRFWLRGWLSRYKKVTVHKLRRQLTPMVRRQKYDLRQLHSTATFAAHTMAQRIVKGEIRPKNAASTLAKKAPETRPLIEGGTFVSAIRARLQRRGRDMFVTRPVSK